MSLEKISDKAMDIAGRLSDNTIVSTLKSAFFTLMPVFIVAPVFVFINCVILDTRTGLAQFLPQSAQLTVVLNSLKEVGNVVVNGTLGVASVLLAYGVAYFYCKKIHGEKYAMFTGIGGVVAYFIFTPTTMVFLSEKKEILVNGAISADYLGTGALFTAIIAAMVFAWLFGKLCLVEKIKIKLPEEVPPQIARSFDVVVPFAIAVFGLAIIAALLKVGFSVDLKQIIQVIISEPLRGIGNSYFGYLLISFVCFFGAYLGIHTGFIMVVTTSPIFLMNLSENLAAVQSGLPAPHILTGSFEVAFRQIGGCGATLGFVFAALLFSKDEHYRYISKLGLVPGLFNINEMVWFGLPMVLNPLMFIPFVFGPLLTVTLSYLAIGVGLVPPLIYDVPWTTPPVLISFLASGGSWIAAVWNIFMIVLAALIYVPFIKLNDRMNKKRSINEL